MTDFTISAWTIYWITRLDAINVTMGISMFLSLAFVGGLFLKFALIGEEYLTNADIAYSNWFKRVWKKILILPTVILFFLVFLPTTKEMIAIYTISAMSNNTDVQAFAKEAVKLPKNVLEGANKLLESWVNEANKESK